MSDLREKLDMARPAPTGNGASDTFDLLTFEELLERPDPEFIIDGLVPVGLAVFRGASGAGKSFAAIDLALCVASGLDWHGHRVIKPGYVVYVAAEGQAGMTARSRAWWLGHDRPDMSRIRYLLEAVNLRDSALLDRVRCTLASLPEQPALVVVDTMARSMPGADENSAKEVGEFIAAVDALRDAGSALIVHHTGRAGDDERGSTALQCAADLRVRVVRREGRRVDLICSKMKDGDEWPPIALSLETKHGSCVLSPAVDAAGDNVRGKVLAARDEVREKVLAVSEGLRERVLALVIDQGPISANRVVRKIAGRRSDVLEALNGLESSWPDPLSSVRCV